MARETDPSVPALSLSAGREVQLVVMAGPGLGQIFAPRRGRSIIGCDENAEIQILDGGVAHEHAVICFDKERRVYVLDNLGHSTTTLNGAPLTGPHVLQRADKIGIGSRTVLWVCFADDLEARFARRMYQAVLRDGLTGAFNRRYFEERLDTEAAFASRHGTSLALIMIDLDNFKSINDTYGHPCGDAVLQQLAYRLGRAVRIEDILARYGGEEFAVICRDTDEAQAAVIAERLRRMTVSDRFTTETASLEITISAGVAALRLSHGAIDDAVSLVRAADRALYRAKDLGRNRIVKYSELDDV